MELGNVPQPSEEIIVKIAAALHVDKKVLLSKAKKVDPEISQYVVSQPQATDFSRVAKDKEFKTDDWDLLPERVEPLEPGRKT